MLRCLPLCLTVWLTFTGCATPELARIDLPAQHNGRPVTIIINVGSHWVRTVPYNSVPTFALWWEDMSGRFIDTVYVTHKAARDGWMMSGGSRRPYSLPVWSHRRNVQNEDGGYMPSKAHPLPDAVTAASPRVTRQAVIAAGYTPPPEKAVLYLEINHSNDWNDSYPEKAAPGADDRPADNGQPSLVYRAEIDFIRGGTFTLVPVGTGDLNGRNGRIEADLSRLTTALDIASSVTVKVR